MGAGLQRARAAARETQGKHPCHGLSAPARRAFERIAINQDPLAQPQTLAALMKRGLIVQTGTKLLGQDRFGRIAIPVYAVPLPVHAQWCQWCSDNITDEEIETNS